MMNKESLVKKDLYKELPEKEGISTLFRKFEERTWIFQFKGDEHIGTILLDNEDLEYIYKATPLKEGDGSTAQE